MWIFTNNAFISAVQDRNNRDYVHVRGRFKGDLERFLKDTHKDVGRYMNKIAHTPDADYAYRVSIPWQIFSAALIASAAHINYPKFKPSIEEPWRHDMALRVWNITYEEQEEQKNLLADEVA